MYKRAILSLKSQKSYTILIYKNYEKTTSKKPFEFKKSNYC